MKRISARDGINQLINLAIASGVSNASKLEPDGRVGPQLLQALSEMQTEHTYSRAAKACLTSVCFAIGHDPIRYLYAGGILLTEDIKYLQHLDERAAQETAPAK